MAKQRGGRRSKPNGDAQGSPAPLVDSQYMEMLQEYQRGERKKRKFEPPVPDQPAHSVAKSERETSGAAESSHNDDSSMAQSHDIPSQQNTARVADSDIDTDSDEFEDVELDEDDVSEGIEGDGDILQPAVKISLDAAQARTLARRGREPGPPRYLRIATHRIALTVWMVHARIRSIWLSSRQVRRSPILKTVLSQRVLRQLFPPGHLTDFLKSKRFIEGLRAAMEEWKSKFNVVNGGLASLDDNKGDSATREAYLRALFSLRGSTDLLGQGFFGVLRALGIRARLVSSLQPPDNLGSNTESSRKNLQSDAPVFWVEVWDRWTSGWISADPLTSTVRPPLGGRAHTAIEPKSADKLNVLRYCMAWERGCARDVTRRYSSAYNARTRKKRLPHFEGDEWLNQLLAYFGPKSYSKADLAEIRELAKYSRREGIPTRVQDFVGHPRYALADKLHYNELLKPEATPCGTLANKGKPPTYIYHRGDVLSSYSAQSWYRKGRSIKAGEQPVLYRDTKNRLTGESEAIGLYTAEQTELYRPPPVDSDGTVPKSQYRTIDVFTETMIPDGAVHIKDPQAAEAAKLLRVDYANAVTSVEFGKRGPQSKTFGAVVARSNEPAMRLALNGLRELERDEAARRENARILGLWRQYIVGIQIWDRVEHMNPQFDRTPGNNEIEGENILPGRSSESSDSDWSETGALSDDSELGDRIYQSHRDIKNEEDLEGSRSEHLAEKGHSNNVPRKREVIHITNYGGMQAPGTLNTLADPSPSTSNFATAGFEHPGTSLIPPADSSPSTHSSFSDLDVDELTDSDLRD